LPRNLSEQKKARDLYSIVLVAGDYNTMDHPFGAFAHLQEVLEKSVAATVARFEKIQKSFQLYDFFYIFL